MLTICLATPASSQDAAFMVEDPRFRPLAQCYTGALQIYANMWREAAAKARSPIQELHRILIMTGGYGAAAEEIIPICDDDFRQKAQDKNLANDVIRIASHVFRVEAMRQQADVYANCLLKETDPAWRETFQFCQMMYERDKRALQ